MSLSEAHVSDTKLDNSLRFRLSRYKDIDFLITETNDREKMSNTFNKNIPVLDYADKILLLSGGNSGVSLCSLTTVIFYIYQETLQALTIKLTIKQ